MKKLYFVRHGESEFTAKGIIAGTSETPLSAKGRVQAKQAGEQAKSLNIDYILSSPQSRALETANIIAKEIGYPIEKIHVNKLFVERDYGALEGMPWRPDMDLDGVANIEPLETILERAKVAVDLIKNIDADNILVVAHGAIGRAIRHIFFPDMPFSNRSSTTQFKLQNGEIVQWL